MYYGIEINGKNILKEYGLILLADLVVEGPKVKENYISIPGGDGSLNLSNWPQDSPTYQERAITGTLFRGIPDTELETIRAELCNLYQGQTVRLILPNDFTHYWRGEIQFGDLSEYNSGSIPFSFRAHPWKLKLDVTTVTQQITNSGTLTLENEARPAIPTITADAAVTVAWGDTIAAIAPNTPTRPSGWLLPAGETVLTVTGSATVTITYQEGSL